MTDDRRYRSAYRDDPPARDDLLTETIDMAVRRIVTGLVLAGGLIGAGIYLSGSAEPARYQVTTTGDGRIVRLNTDSGSLVACEGNDCWVLQYGNRDLPDEPPQRNESAAQPAAPAQLPAPQAEAAPAPEQQPQPEAATR